MIIVAATVAVVGGTFALIEYNRGPQGVSSMEPVGTVKAEELLNAFVADEALATGTYVGEQEQAVQVSGAIGAMEEVGEGKTNVILETGDPLAGIVCEFATKDIPITWRSGATVSVKGICTGILLDVVLVRCVAVE